MNDKLNNLLETYEYDGVGYHRGIEFESWTVAVLNYAERFDKIEKLERHNLTDEVFILVEGEATLILGEEMTCVPMVKNKMYNVKAGAWHNVKVSHDAKIIIVENANTSKENTEYLPVTFVG
ncbi:MAG: cupin [Clostridia bacterium]|nr:cupin [Clostridia bacterium]